MVKRRPRNFRDLIKGQRDLRLAAFADILSKRVVFAHMDCLFLKQSAAAMLPAAPAQSIAAHIHCPTAANITPAGSIRAPAASRPTALFTILPLFSAYKKDAKLTCILRFGSASLRPAQFRI